MIGALLAVLEGSSSETETRYLPRTLFAKRWPMS